MVAAKTAKKTTPSTPSSRSGQAKKTSHISGDISIVETGGKQYIVAEGSKIRIEKMSDSHKVGDSVTFEKVMLSQSGDATTIGTPYISGAKVGGEITKIGRDKKVTVIKYKAKSRYFKKRGHRQPFVEVKITKVA